MTPSPVDVVVIGASFAGLFAAAAAQRAGRSVLVVERDELTDDTAERPGVPQGGQPHVLLHRGLVAIEGLLPGLRAELIAAGGVPFDTGQMVWLSADGWLPTSAAIYEVVSLSRPLLERSVRRRVSALPGIEFRTETRVSGLRPEGGRWQVTCSTGRSPSPETGVRLESEHGHRIDGSAGHEADDVISASMVIDASGRSSRLSHWLAELGFRVLEPTVVEAKLGYATRRYRSLDRLPIRVGVLVAATPETERGALALPVENNEWLVCAAGFGDHRPTRDPAGFERYLSQLQDPLLADITAMLEPVGDVRIHRQTANRRQNYHRLANWPAGLLVVGDALTAFNPVYGQGITVAACQAELIGQRLSRPLDAAATGRLERRLAKVADLPWAIATGEDVRFPSCDTEPTVVQRLLHRWSHRVSRLAASGNTTCLVTQGSIYHLMAPAHRIFGPRIAGPVLRSLFTGIQPPAPRPAELDALLPGSR